MEQAIKKLKQSLNTISEYDMNKLKEAQQLVKEVYEFYYGCSAVQPFANRTCTIYNKLTELINEWETQ